MDYQTYSDFYYNPQGKTYVFGVDSSPDVYKFLTERKNEWKAIILYIHNFHYDYYGASWLRDKNKQTLEQFQDFIDKLILKKIQGWKIIGYNKVCQNVLTICKENGIPEVGYRFFINNEEWLLATKLFHQLPLERIIAIYPEAKKFLNNDHSRFLHLFIREKEKREALEAENRELRAFPGGPDYQKALENFNNFTNY